MENKLRKMFAEKRPAVGTFFNVGDMSCMECLGYTGLDYVIIDCEHGPYDTESMMNLIRAAESVNLVPVVRIANVNHKEIQRAADCGAEALIVPCLYEVEEFRNVINFAKYPPIGNRGFIKGRGSGFGNMDWANKDLESFMANSNEKLMVLPQCETRASLEHIEEIMALDGVDGIFVGPFDLSIGMGIPGQFDNPVFEAAIARIFKACKDNNKPAYIYSGSVEESRKRLAQGADGVATSMSSSVLTAAYKDIASQVKA